MQEFYEALGIKRSFVVVYHPKINGQTEAINKIIKHTLKANLDESKRNWPEELPRVLWSRITTLRSTTGDTPFSLTMDVRPCCTGYYVIAIALVLS